MVHEILMPRECRQRIGDKSGVHRPKKVDPRLVALERHVAKRIRQRRRQIGLTQMQLAELMGVTYQMVHRYERGICRIFAGHLHALAGALDTDVTYFFEHVKSGPIKTIQQDYHRRLDELLDNVLSIAEPRYQQAVYVVAKAMTAGAAADEENKN